MQIDSTFALVIIYSIRRGKEHQQCVYQAVLSFHKAVTFNSLDVFRSITNYDAAIRSSIWSLGSWGRKYVIKDVVIALYCQYTTHHQFKGLASR